MYVGTSPVTAAFLGTTQVYPNIVYPIMGTFSVQSDTTSTPQISDGSTLLTVTTDNNDFYVTTIPQMHYARLMFSPNLHPTNDYSPVTTITRVDFVADTCANMFRSMKYLTSVNLSMLNTSNATEIQTMFQDCSSLTTLDISMLATSSAQCTSSMFKNCTSLTTLNMSNFDMSGVNSSRRDMYEDMFMNVPSNCVITMNDVSNATFNMLTDYTNTRLNTSIIIMRDGVRYAYDSTRDEWVQQQARYELLDEIHATQMDTYIDTLYTCTIDTRIEVRYLCNGQYQSDHPRLFSTGSSWSGSDTIAIDYEGNVNMYVKFNNTTDWNRSSGVTWDETSSHTVIYTHTDVTYDNNIVVSRAMTSFVTQSNTLCIGMLRDNNPPSSSQSFLKYIEFKLYESTTQTRNYVAAKRLSDNKYGMYDTLNDTFLSSAGSNEYTGTSKSTPQYIY